MTVYYWDTSALVKRYAQEPGSQWVRQLLTDEVATCDHYTVRVTGPEMIAAVFRKVRMGHLSQVEATTLVNHFRLHWQQPYQILEVTVRVAELAMSLAERHGLRGYDSVPLAAALVLQDVRQSMNLPSLTLVSADLEQLQAGLQEGLLVENPNDYS